MKCPSCPTVLEYFCPSFLFFCSFMCSSEIYHCPTVPSLSLSYPSIPSYSPTLHLFNTVPSYYSILFAHPTVPLYGSFLHPYLFLPNFPSYCSVLSGHSEWILRVVIMMALSMVRFKWVNQMVNFVGQF